jgi:methionyl aminopeptidase
MIQIKMKKKQIKPHKITPTRSVPSHIKRPPYAREGISIPDLPLQKAELIKRMRIAGESVRRTLLFAKDFIKPGVTTEEIDEIVHNYIIEHDYYPSTVGYNGFTKACCTSVNEVICHGIPDSRPLENGDIVNLDITVYVNGVHGDHSETFLVGEVDEESKLLVAKTKEAMWAGINAVAPGKPINEIGKAIEAVIADTPFSVVRDYIGHGINQEFHTSPQVLHYYDSRNTELIQKDMTFTIEPMINVGVHQGKTWKDGWTVVTKDRKRSAQFEHTILVTADGAEVLTLLPEEKPS